VKHEPDSSHYMKLQYILSLGFICTVICISCVENESATTSKKTIKEPLRREDSFFGLHFDFHAGYYDNKIGETLSYELLDSMLSMVKPDYVQIDCKGHAGISSYPTKVGYPASGFVKDPYPVWRDATRKNGVTLFVHYSGLYDCEAVKKHPGWAILDSNGKHSASKASVKGPYVDSILIPQFKELIDNYEINGGWVDGECWALELDYSDYMLKAFLNETGMKKVPCSPDDEGWNEFFEFNRRSFRQYVRHYVDELHKYDPDFQITSNWAFSSLMPEPVDINIDFISGDFTPNNSVYSGLYEARCIAPQGKPWDLMAWSFAYDGKTGTSVVKSPVQLMQTAATVISMGGGYQVYFQQNRDASIKPWNFGLMKEVADFCRERQPFCKGSVPVPQIALLYSTANFKKNSERLYHNSSKINDPIKGILNMLLDKQNAVEILMEHHLKGRMDKYPLIIIPECQYLESEFIEELLQYVNEGGNLLIIGAETLNMFSGQLNVELKESVPGTRHLAWDDQMAGINTVFRDFIPGNDVETCGKVFSVPDFRFPYQPAATITKYGKGEIAAVYFNIGSNYLKMSNPVYRNFIHSMVRELFPEPMVEVTGSEHIAITLNQLNNKIALHLINMSGEHANTNVARFDDIPPVGPLQVKMRLDKRPKKLMLQPDNIPLKYKYVKGELKTEIKKIDIHSIVIIE